MRPLQLKIEGLNSIIEEQIIPFETLISKGLFGIFGPTGSGKSTILDGMILALYGEIPRSSKRQAKDFINSECNQLSVSYTFALHQENREEVYVVERNIKRENQSYRTTLARLYQRNSEGKNTVISEGVYQVGESIQDLIGLTMEDFTRSVVLPQGQFSDFLKLSGSDRRNMLERLFGLEEYGQKLRDKIRRAKRAHQDQQLVVETQLSYYQGVSQEIQKQMKEEYETLEKQREKLQQQWNQYIVQYEKWEKQWKDQQEYRFYQEQKAEHQKQKVEIEKINDKLVKGRQCDQLLPFIVELEKIQHELKEIRHQKSLGEEKLQSLNQYLVQIGEQYQESLKNKKERYPLLLQKQQELERALELQKEWEEVVQERAILAEEYIRLKNKMKSLKKEYDQREEDIQQREKQWEVVGKRKNQITIDPLLRQKIYFAYELEKEYQEYQQKITKLSKKLEKSKETIEETQDFYKEQEKEYQKILQELSLLQEKQEQFTRKTPPSSEQILAKKEQIENYKYQIKQAKQQEEMIQTLQKERVKIQEEIQAIEKLKEKYHHSLQIVRTQKKEYQEQQKQYELEAAIYRLRETLKDGETCLVCGNTYHTKHQKESIFSIEQLDYKKLKEEILSLEQQIESLEKKKGMVESQEIFLNNQRKNKKIELENILQQRENLSIEVLQKQYQVIEQTFISMQEQKNQWEKQNKQLEHLLGKKQEEKYKREAELAKLKERLGQAKINEKTIQEDLEQQRKQGKDQQMQYEQIKDELQLHCIQEKIEEIREWDQELSILQQQEKEYREEIKEYTLQKEQYNQNIQALKETSREKEVLGKEKRERIDRLHHEIHAETKEQEPSEYLQRVKQEIIQMIEKEETLRNKKESLQEERQKQLETQITIEQKDRTLNESKEKQSQRLQEEMKKTVFQDIEAVMKYQYSTDEKDRWEQAIIAYNEKEQRINYDLQKLKEKLTEPWLEEEQWVHFQQEKEQTAQLLDEKTAQIAVTKNQLEEMEEKLKQRKQLIQKKNKLDMHWDLLDELDKLVQGNRFVEFIAMYQLQYIAKEATKTLKEITRGRYALELDDEGNFIMRDDFNGGTRRNTNTLSGGETFLTSLSLALALSSQVQLKNQAPLEIFFLDEGFGTLDQDLLDIVMGALERLPSQKLAVGIISHVEELKNRVPAKMIVEPAKQGISGSQVYIE